MESKPGESAAARPRVETSELATSAELTPGGPGWEGLEQTKEFRQLVTARWRFVVPATVFFLVYYFALPILNGTASEFMKTRVLGSVNIAYLFALSEFFMAWILAWLYIRRANNVFDRLAEAVRARAGRQSGEVRR